MRCSGKWKPAAPNMPHTACCSVLRPLEPPGFPRKTFLVLRCPSQTYRTQSVLLHSYDDFLVSVCNCPHAREQACAAGQVLSGTDCPPCYPTIQLGCTCAGRALLGGKLVGPGSCCIPHSPHSGHVRQCQVPFFWTPPASPHGWQACHTSWAAVNGSWGL